MHWCMQFQLPLGICNTASGLPEWNDFCLCRGQQLQLMQRHLWQFQKIIQGWFLCLVGATAGQNFSCLQQPFVIWISFAVWPPLFYCWQVVQGVERAHNVPELWGIMALNISVLVICWGQRSILGLEMGVLFWNLADCPIHFLWGYCGCTASQTLVQLPQTVKLCGGCLLVKTCG
jgi:hypothetical protein